MNVLALDFGLKRIGVAYASTEVAVAFPRPLLPNDAKLFDALKNIVKEDKISLILVGMPYQKDGKRGDIYSELDDFLDELKETISVDVELYDERFTSRIAERKLSKVGIKVKDQKELSDSVSAQILLQEWMEENF